MTGVQTCALPIYSGVEAQVEYILEQLGRDKGTAEIEALVEEC